MAKAGFWMRGARGKLAGASFGKGANGNTIQREIVTPKNPNTNPQLFQRAIMATIMRAYSAGKEVFDHAYEGVSVGSKCQQKFMSDNLKSLRSTIFGEYAGTVAVADMKGRVVARGGIAPVANAYKISEGTLTNGILTNSTSPEQFLFADTDDSTLTVAGWCQQLGIVADDIFTICAYMNNPEVVIGGIEGVEAAQYVAGSFAYARLQVKPEALTLNTTIATATLEDVFTIVTDTANGVDGNTLLSSGIDVSVWGNGYVAGAAACIRSRENSKLRSSETMKVYNKGTHDWGIKAPYIVNTWKKGGNTLGDSDLLLEGGDTGNADNTPINFVDVDLAGATIKAIQLNNGKYILGVEDQEGEVYVISDANGNVPVSDYTIDGSTVDFNYNNDFDYINRPYEPAYDRVLLLNKSFDSTTSELDIVISPAWDFGLEVGGNNRISIPVL